MRRPQQLSGAFVWTIAILVVSVAAQEASEAPVPRSCTTPEECSGPWCAGAGRVGVCLNKVCECQTTTPGAEVISGDGDDVSEVPACSRPEECDLPDCVDEGKVIACESSQCVCQTRENSGQDEKVVPTGADKAPTIITSEITNEDGSLATVIIIQGGPVHEPITAMPEPSAMVNIAGEDFHNTIASVSSSVLEDILPLITVWAEAPEPTKAQPAIDGIRGLIPTLGDIAGGLENGEQIFACSEADTHEETEERSIDERNDLILQLQDFNCDLLTILGLMEEHKGSTEPDAGETLQEALGNLPQDLSTIVSKVQEIGHDASCASEEGCQLPECPEGETPICADGKCNCATGNENEDDHQDDNDNNAEDEQPTTTLTILPPEVSTETITDHVTENMVTTTTSSGSDEPTIVPIIVPIGKPPIICWSCVPLPAKVQIKTEDFCVNIFEFSIGNCPPGDHDKEDDNDDNNDKHEEEDEEEDKEEDEEETSSCSTIVTATYASVFCTVTGTDIAQRKREEGCSTFEYSTITACETALASTTTTTATVDSSAICRPGRCSNGGCRVDARSPHSEKVKRQPPAPKREPGFASWYSPHHYYNRFEFMRGEVAKACQDPNSHVNLEFRLRNPHDLITTGRWAAFRNQPLTVAAAGLWGCTVVVAVSKRGVWIAHFWEGEPGLVADNLGGLRDGPNNLLDRGLGTFRNQQGDSGDMFNDEADPKVYIFTRIRSRDPYIMGEQGDHELLGVIRVQLAAWWGRPPTVKEQIEVKYEPLPDPILPPDDPDYPNMRVPGFDARFPGDPEFISFRGKVMVQYEPALLNCQGRETTGRKAGYRIWFQAGPPRKGDTDTRWDPLDQQVAFLPNEKRGEDCIDLDEAADVADAIADALGDAESNREDEKQEDSEASKKCASVDDCQDLSCTPAEERACTDGQCRCINKRCSEPDDCLSLTCNSNKEVRSCDDGQCSCKENKCAKSEDCGFMRCEETKEATCKDDKCSCQEKVCSKAEDDCKHLDCKDTEEKDCKDRKCVCKDKFTSGVCRTYIFETGHNDKGFQTRIVIYDGAGTEIGWENRDEEYSPWGEKVFVESKLPYKVEYEFLEEWLGSESKRDRPERYGTLPVKYQTYSIRLKADQEVWDTETQDEEGKRLPRCDVGKWRNKNELDEWNVGQIIVDFFKGGSDETPMRAIDCYWKC